MEDRDNIRTLPDGRVLLDHGPMTLSAYAEKDGQAMPDAAEAGVERALAEFEALLEWLPLAKRWIGTLDDRQLRFAPEVLRRMVCGVRLLEDPEFTPMAAVAGTFSDMICQEICRRSDARRVIVNNGGDIAFSLADPLQELAVGIVSDIACRNITHRLTVPGGQGIHGIATSGFGGRSLSRGIASAVTVLAESCCVADAAATDIANHTDADDPAIFRCMAEELDYNSDIAGLTVVREIGRLRQDTALQALQNGFDRAKALWARGVIRGAVLFAGNRFTYYPDDLNVSENYNEAKL